MFLTYGFGDLHDSSKQENFPSAKKKRAKPCKVSAITGFRQM